MKTRPLLTLALSALTSCNVFDETLYLNRLDSGVSGADASQPGDTGVTDGGSTSLVLTLADACNGGAVPVVQPNGGTLIVDTRNLRDDFNDLAACTGSTPVGNDGFFAVDMTQGEKWHFHVKVPAGPDMASINPVVYVLGSCDERDCQPGAGLDECSTGRDEHISYTAPQTQRYFVGIDTRAAGGAGLELLVVKATCGNGGTLEHGESCDDGNTMPNDGCDAQCRTEMVPASNAEKEPNDDYTNANVIMAKTSTSTDLTVTGRLGGRCDYDMFAVNVPANGKLAVTMLDANGNPCAADAPALTMTFFRRDGLTVGGSGVVVAPNRCPGIDPNVQTFAKNLTGGLYYVRVTTTTDIASTFAYQLHVTASP